MAGIKPEFDLVHPEAELKMLKVVIRSTEKALADAEKELVTLSEAQTYTLEIVLRDAEGAVVVVGGADGELYDKITYNEVSGKNVKSLLTQAGIGLSRVLPDEGNLRMRIGGRQGQLRSQLQEYKQRKLKAENLILVMAKRAAGEA